MNDQILLSICIPTYNRANCIEKCLQSITSQKGFSKGDVEILISDNASPDNTEEVVKSFQDKFSNIRYIRNDANIGAERNMLNLLNNFYGEYFFLLTDDDILLPDSIKKLRETIINNPNCSAFLSSYEVFSERQRRTYIRHTFLVSKIIPHNDIRSIVKFYNASSVASRICIKKKYLNLEGYTRHIRSMYPQMYLVGYAALNGTAYYIEKPLIRHTSENEIFWDYPSDYMLNGKIELIKDLNRLNNMFYTVAFTSLIRRDIPSSLIDTIVKRHNKFCKLIKVLFKTPSIGLKPIVWIKIIYNLLRQLSGIMIRKIYKIFYKSPYHYYESI